MDIYQILVEHNRSWSRREIICFVTIFLLISFIAMYLLYLKKIRLSQMLSSLLAVVFLAVVLASTVFTRQPAPGVRYELQVLWSWREIFLNHNREMLKENLLNCVLLFPLGLMLPVIFHQRIGCLKGFLCGFVLSAAIEIGQLLLHRGLFEWDDMIHNALGCMAGCVVAELILTNVCNSHRSE